MPIEAIVRIEDVRGRDVVLGGRGSVDVVARGGSGAAAPFLFNQSAVTTMLDGLTAEYDLVMVDSPPLLEVAYAGSVIDLADATLAVVAHGQSTRTVREFRDQLDLLAVPVVGYVYDHSNVSLNVTRAGS
jgi:Mrp family chromosome partitioning ATPase